MNSLNEVFTVWFGTGFSIATLILSGILFILVILVPLNVYLASRRTQKCLEELRKIHRTLQIQSKILDKQPDTALDIETTPLSKRENRPKAKVKLRSHDPDSIFKIAKKHF